ncbi:DUF1801 domain-containing protein [Pedobacter sp. KBW06]|nr:DUF1801 domain-containing protein [Pedobacter sp. KBW06]
MEMKSKAATVDEYFLEIPEKRVALPAMVRALCKEVLIGYEEHMACGMPAYSRNGLVALTFAIQKNQISFYTLKEDAVHANVALSQGLEPGKPVVRFDRLEGIDFELVRKLLVDVFTDEQAHFVKHPGIG